MRILDFVASAPDVHLGGLGDQILPEIGVCQVDDGLRLLPGGCRHLNRGVPQDQL